MKNNFFEQIDISKELDKAIESGIQVAVLKKRRRKIKIISISISAFIFSNLVFLNNNSFASVKDFFISIANYFSTSDDLSDYKATIGSSVSNGGYTVTVNEALVNENELVISSTIKSDDGPISSEVNLDPTILINGKEVRYECDEMLDYEDDTTINSMGTYRLNKDLVGDLEVELQYEPMRVRGDSEVNNVKGSWNFTFNVDADALEENSTVIDLNQVVALNPDITIELKKYTNNAFNTTIETTVNGDMSSLEVKLIGSDNLGNNYEFMVSKLYLDENFIGGATFSLDTEASKLNNDATELRLYPYCREFDSNDDFNKVGNEIVINLK